jgi:hypothetical protein
LILGVLSPLGPLWNLSCIFGKEHSMFYKGFPEVDIEKAMKPFEQQPIQYFDSHNRKIRMSEFCRPKPIADHDDRNTHDLDIGRFYE